MESLTEGLEDRKERRKDRGFVDLIRVGSNRLKTV